MPSSSKRISINLLLCSILHGFNHYLMIFFKPLYPQIAAYYNLSTVSELTTRLTLAYVGYGLSNFFCAFLGRYLRLKHILFAGMCLMSLSIISLAFIPANSYQFAIVIIFLMGLGGGVYHPAANTLVTSQNEKKHGRSIGLLSLGSALGFILAPLIGTYVGRDLLGFKLLFVLSGSISLVISILFQMFFKENLAKPNLAKTKNDTLNIKPAKFLLLLILLLIPTVLREIMNWSYYEITPYWVLAGFSAGIGIEFVQMMAYLPGLLFQPITGYLCDRLGPKKMAIFTILLACLGFLFLAMQSLPFILTGLFLFGTGMSSSTVANETFLASLGTAKERLLLYGIVLSVALGAGGYLGGLSGLLLDFFGKQSPFGYQLWYSFMALSLALSLISYLFIKKTH